ncbi:MAG: Uncharacterised protein [Synechococcus sp. CC9902]|nr:MAG: Uncharacterised protein [Synechococcus sp. CC9902]
MLHHLQLQLSDCGEDWVSLALIGVVKDLHRTLFSQFIDSLAEIFEGRGVWIAKPAEYFGTETGDPFIFHFRSHIERVTNGEHAWIVQTDHIAREGIFNNSAFLSEQFLRTR